MTTHSWEYIEKQVAELVEKHGPSAETRELLRQQIGDAGLAMYFMLGYHNKEEVRHGRENTGTAGP